MYSQKVIDHFQNPRNVGIIEDANVIVEVGDPSCGDALLIFLKIADEHITDIKFKVFGCGAAIATSSMASELVMGRSLDEVLALREADISEALDGLPPEKEHCSNLSCRALHAAVNQYREAVEKEAATAAEV